MYALLEFADELWLGGGTFWSSSCLKGVPYSMHTSTLVYTITALQLTALLFMVPSYVFLFLEVDSGTCAALLITPSLLRTLVSLLMSIIQKSGTHTIC